MSETTMNDDGPNFLWFFIIGSIIIAIVAMFATKQTVYCTYPNCHTPATSIMTDGKYTSAFCTPHAEIMYNKGWNYLDKQ